MTTAKHCYGFWLNTTSEEEEVKKRSCKVNKPKAANDQEEKLFEHASLQDTIHSESCGASIVWYVYVFSCCCLQLLCNVYLCFKCEKPQKTESF